MKPIIQEDNTGCAIASAATLSGLSYKEVKNIANAMGIRVEDPDLWSETRYMRSLLEKLAINIGNKEIAFDNWDSLPNCALLAIKWHLEKGKPYWHWVVFIREHHQMYVLDSKKSLKTHIRTDFWRIKPKWFIKVNI